MAVYTTAALAYGVCVHVADLAAAARAFAYGRPTLLSLGMIARRRERGTLARADPSEGAVGRVPVEVWELIREEVVNLSVLEGRRALHKEFCYACHPGFRAPATARSMWALNWMHHMDNYDDNIFYDTILDVNQDLDSTLGSADLKALLASYGLYLPLTENISPSPEYWSTAPHLAALAVRARSPAGAAICPATRCEIDGPHNGDDKAAAVVRLAPSVLQLPRDANRRLQRFLSDYHVATDEGVVVEPTTVGATAFSAPRQRQRGWIRQEPTTPPRPEWMLVHTLEADGW